MNSRRILRSFATLLSVVYFATNCALAHIPETTIWTERKKSSPHAVSGDLYQESLWRDNVRDPRLKILGMTDGTTLKSLSAFGTIRKIAHPTGPSKGTIIHIQDVHKNVEAQTNIASAIETLLKNKRADVVALEGAFGPMNLQGFQNYSKPKTIRAVADFLLKENKITGPMRTLLTTGGASIIGVDDETHYEANVEAYRQASTLMASKRNELAGHEKKLEQRKSEIFSSSLQTLDAAVTAYRTNKIGMGEYAKTLARHTAAPAQAKIFLDALRLESGLDFARVERERGQAIEKLLSSLDKPRIDQLVTMSAAYRRGEISNGDFYRAFKTLCSDNGVSLDRWTALKNYLDYVLLCDSIEAEKLLAELKTMEHRAFNALAKTPAERALLAEAKQLYLVRKLVDFALTKAEWEEYSSPAAAGLYSFEAFYREAEIRDQKMAENFLERSPIKTFGDDGVAVLVTGGFHSSGIDSRLLDAGYTVVQFTPKITKVDTDNGSAYLTAFTQEKTPLEKIFAGQKLFVSQRQAENLLMVPVGVAAVDGVRAFNALLPTADAHVLVTADNAVKKEHRSNVTVTTPGGTTPSTVIWTNDQELEIIAMQSNGSWHMGDFPTYTPSWSVNGIALQHAYAMVKSIVMANGLTCEVIYTTKYLTFVISKNGSKLPKQVVKFFVGHPMIQIGFFDIPLKLAADRLEGVFVPTQQITFREGRLQPGTGLNAVLQEFVNGKDVETLLIEARHSAEKTATILANHVRTLAALWKRGIWDADFHNQFHNHLGLPLKSVDLSHLRPFNKDMLDIEIKNPANRFPTELLDHGWMFDARFPGDRYLASVNFKRMLYEALEEVTTEDPLPMKPWNSWLFELNPVTLTAGVLRASWSKMPNKVSDWIDYEDEGAYLVPNAKSKLSPEMLGKIREQVTLQTGKDKMLLHMTGGEKNFEFAWSEEFVLREIGGKKFVLPSDWNLPTDLLEKLLGLAIAGDSELQRLNSDEPFIVLPVSAITSNNHGAIQHHMAGNCSADHFILLDENLTSVIEELMAYPGAGNALLQVLIEHELLHEVRSEPADDVAALEKELAARDAKRFATLLSNLQDVDPTEVLDHLDNSRLIDQMFSFNVREALTTAEPTVPAEAPETLPAPRPAASALAIPAVRGEKIKILHVEDEDSVHSYLSALMVLILEGADLEIAHAADGKEALEILDKESFDLIISDLDMPGMNGIEFYRQLEIFHPEYLPVFAFCSSRSREHLTQAGIPEEVPAVVKPITSENAASISAVLEELLFVDEEDSDEPLFQGTKPSVWDDFWLKNWNLPFLEEALRLVAIVSLGLPGVWIFAILHAFLHAYKDIYSPNGERFSWEEFITRRLPIRILYSLGFTLPYLLLLISPDLKWFAATLAFMMHSINNTWGVLPMSWAPEMKKGKTRKGEDDFTFYGIPKDLRRLNDQELADIGIIIQNSLEKMAPHFLSIPAIRNEILTELEMKNGVEPINQLRHRIIVARHPVKILDVLKKWNENNPKLQLDAEWIGKRGFLIGTKNRIPMKPHREISSFIDDLNEARAKLIRHNFRLIRHRANMAYKNWGKARGIDRSELLDAANLAAMRAAINFDPQRGKFSTLAVHSINRRFRDFLRNKGNRRTVPLTVDVAEKGKEDTRSKWIDDNLMKLLLRKIANLESLDLAIIQLTVLAPSVLTAREAAKVLGKTKDYVKQRKGVILRRLRGELQEVGFPYRPSQSWTGKLGGEWMKEHAMPLLEEWLRLAAILTFGIYGALGYIVVHAALHFWIDIISKSGDQLTWREFLFRRLPIRMLYSAGFTLPYLLVLYPQPFFSLLTFLPFEMNSIEIAFSIAHVVHSLNNIFGVLPMNVGNKWNQWTIPQLRYIGAPYIAALDKAYRATGELNVVDFVTGPQRKSAFQTRQWLRKLIAEVNYQTGNSNNLANDLRTALERLKELVAKPVDVSEADITMLLNLIPWHTQHDQKCIAVLNEWMVRIHLEVTFKLKEMKSISNAKTDYQAVRYAQKAKEMLERTLNEDRLIDELIYYKEELDEVAEQKVVITKEDIREMGLIAGHERLLFAGLRILEDRRAISYKEIGQQALGSQSDFYTHLTLIEMREAFTATTGKHSLSGEMQIMIQAIDALLEEVPTLVFSDIALLNAPTDRHALLHKWWQIADREEVSIGTFKIWAQKDRDFHGQKAAIETHRELIKRLGKYAVDENLKKIEQKLWRLTKTPIELTLADIAEIADSDSTDPLSPAVKRWAERAKTGKGFSGFFGDERTAMDIYSKINSMRGGNRLSKEVQKHLYDTLDHAKKPGVNAPSRKTVFQRRFKKGAPTPASYGNNSRPGWGAPLMLGSTFNRGMKSKKAQEILERNGWEAAERYVREKFTPRDIREILNLWFNPFFVLWHPIATPEMQHEQQIIAAFFWRVIFFYLFFSLCWLAWGGNAYGFLVFLVILIPGLTGATIFNINQHEKFNIANPNSPMMLGAIANDLNKMIPGTESLEIGRLISTRKLPFKKLHIFAQENDFERLKERLAENTHVEADIWVNANIYKKFLELKPEKSDRITIIGVPSLFEEGALNEKTFERVVGHLHDKKALSNALIVAPMNIVDKLLEHEIDPTLPWDEVKFSALEDLLSDIGEIETHNLGRLLLKLKALRDTNTAA